MLTRERAVLGVINLIKSILLTSLYKHPVLARLQTGPTFRAAPHLFAVEKKLGKLSNLYHLYQFWYQSQKLLLLARLDKFGCLFL